MTKSSQSDFLVELEESLARLRSRNQEELADRLARLITIVADEAVARPSFARKLSKTLSESQDQVTGDDRNARRRQVRPLRRPAGVLDPFEIHKKSEAELRHRLEDLDIEQLKDIIAEHGMNRDKLAMKWKTPDRLIDRIVETVKARASKGNVFRD